MDARRLLRSRRELIRDMSMGVVLAGAAGIGGAQMLFSEAAAATEKDLEDVKANGAVALGPLGSRGLGKSHRLLSGEAVTLEVPSGREIANSTALVMGSTPKGLYGFSATQRGLGLSAHAPDYPLDLNGTATLQGGTVAHYTIRNRQRGSRYVTLWQGAHHDLVTYMPDGLAEAINLLAWFTIADSTVGLTVTPKSKSGHNIQHLHHTATTGRTRKEYRLREHSCGRGTSSKRNAWIWRVGSTDWRCSDGQKKVCVNDGGSWQCGRWHNTVCPAII